MSEGGASVPIMPALPSLDLLADAIRGELQGQMRHSERLDTQSGVVMGFAGVLVAVGDRSDPLALVGLGCASLSALLALAAFTHRRHPFMDPRSMRERYLGAEARFTALKLLDLTIASTEMVRGALDRKAARLVLAGRLLGVATVLLVADALVG